MWTRSIALPLLSPAIRSIPLKLIWQASIAAAADWLCSSTFGHHGLSCQTILSLMIRRNSSLSIPARNTQIWASRAARGQGLFITQTWPDFPGQISELSLNIRQMPIRVPAIMYNVCNAPACSISRDIVHDTLHILLLCNLLNILCCSHLNALLVDINTMFSNRETYDQKNIDAWNRKMFWSRKH